MYTPTDTPDGTIFILGNLSAIKDEAYTDIAAKIEEIKRAYETRYELPKRKLSYSLTPREILNGLGFEDAVNDCTKRYFINIIVSYMAMCEVVLTLSGWDECPTASMLVQLAHLMKKEVKFHVPFIKQLENECQ